MGEWGVEAEGQSATGWNSFGLSHPVRPVKWPCNARNMKEHAEGGRERGRGRERGEG